MRLSAIALIIPLALGLLVAPLAAEAQQATKGHRIGWLMSGSPPPDRDPFLEAFRQGLHDLGYAEGQNLIIEYRYAEGSQERLRDLAAELVRLKVEVIVAGGTSDAVGQGFVASLARPGGNITGLSNLMVDLPGKRLELLKETVPQSARIAVLANPGAPYHEPWISNLTMAARALGLQLHVVELRRADELDTAFAAMTQERADALILLEDSLLLSGLRGRIVDLAAKHRLPAMYAWRELVVAGGLMSYGPSQLDMHWRTAVYVDKILKGTKPADLPVEQPTKFEFVINLKTAQALDLTIPPSILFQADEVIR